MNLDLVRQRLQAILGRLCTSVPVLVEPDGDGLAVHSGMYTHLGPGTDWAGLLIALGEIDVDQDDDVRWDEAMEVVLGAAEG